LNESWVNNGNWEPQVIDGVTFGVKFLGSALVGKAGSAEAAEATKTVIQMVRRRLLVIYSFEHLCRLYE
ncbi:unnamed protein product, partial [Allacma fusca]